MHELAITQAILDTALRHAERAQVTTIRALHLRLGELSGWVPDSIQFYFDVISQGTPAQGAQLFFTRVPPRAQCRACGAVRDWAFDSQEWLDDLGKLDACACGAKDYTLEGGTGCFLDEMEAE